jgi:hypothetical protein
VITAPALAAGSAPEELRNKTVTLSWTTSGQATSTAGQSRNYTNTNRRTVYISSAGRPFLRMHLSGGGNSRSGDVGPGEKPTGVRTGSVNFEGGKLIGVEGFTSGARQWTATFDGSYSSCTLSIVDAKEGNAAIQRRGPDGVLYKIDSVATGAPSCSIQSGNALSSGQ